MPFTSRRFPTTCNSLTEMVDSTFFFFYLQATVNGTLRLSLHYLFIVRALDDGFYSS